MLWTPPALVGCRDRTNTALCDTVTIVTVLGDSGAADLLPTLLAVIVPGNLELGLRMGYCDGCRDLDTRNHFAVSCSADLGVCHCDCGIEN